MNLRNIGFTLRQEIVINLLPFHNAIQFCAQWFFCVARTSNTFMLDRNSECDSHVTHINLSSLLRN
jgi:hypothetical protein